MKVYRFFSKLYWFKSYTAKVMFVAVAGIYLPLLGVIGIILFAPHTILNQIAGILLAVGFTVLAGVLTMHIISSLIAPVRNVQIALSAYSKYGGMSSLPEHCNDELGTLMSEVNSFVRNIHKKLADKDQKIKSLSTDMRAPLAGILTQITLLRTEKDPVEIEKYLRNIDVLTNRQLKLMDGMLYNYNDKIINHALRLNPRNVVNKASKVLL